MRILSLDLGIKSMGACISDKLNIIPTPLENFFFKENHFNEAIFHFMNNRGEVEGRNKDKNYQI